jgi:hypothetical protein
MARTWERMFGYIIGVDSLPLKLPQVLLVHNRKFPAAAKLNVLKEQFLNELRIYDLLASFSQPKRHNKETIIFLHAPRILIITATNFFFLLG